MNAGVRINCFGPGATDTPLWRIGKTGQEIERPLAAGFVYQPDDFSSVVVFLTSDMSCPLNGEFINRDLHRQEFVAGGRQIPGYRGMARFGQGLCSRVPKKTIDS